LIWEFLIQLKYLAILTWAIYAIFVAIGLMGYRYKANKIANKYCDMKFVIVSIANQAVKKSLFECINHQRKHFQDFHLTLLIDEGAELTSEITKMNSIVQIESVSSKGGQTPIRAVKVNELDNSFSITIVPNDYRRDLVGKGRAINYFVESKVSSNIWYTFLDDDCQILDDNFLYELPFYEQNGFTLCNATIMPRLGKSRATFIMDFIRRYDDVTLSRLFTGRLKSPLIGLHGEMLIVKGSTLKEIGFANRSITEDFRFGLGFVNRKQKAWQSATMVSIRSPNNISDFFKQRGRWFRGIAQDLRFAPTAMKILVGTKLFLWVIGIFGTCLLAPLWLYWDITWALVFSIGGLCPWTVLIYSIVKTKQPLYYILMIPIFGVLESISFLFGLRQNKFVVIDKN
jgi:egghead protein (zeste-white 4 protein)